jgi:hypothetical protein
MSDSSRIAEIENLVDDLIEIYQAQAADLREFAQATAANEGTVHLERNLRRREAQRAELYSRFEHSAFPKT